MRCEARHVRVLLDQKISGTILEKCFWQQRTSRRGVCLPIFLRPVVDVTRLIPDARAVDMMMAIECKAVIQADMFSQRSVDKTPSRDSGE
jgi:hypothetical protein